MVPKNINSDNSVIKLRISALHDLVIRMLFIVESIKALEHEFKDSPKVFWGWSSHKNIAKTVNNS